MNISVFIVDCEVEGLREALVCAVWDLTWDAIYFFQMEGAMRWRLQSGVRGVSAQRAYIREGNKYIQNPPSFTSRLLSRLNHSLYKITTVQSRFLVAEPPTSPPHLPSLRSNHHPLLLFQVSEPTSTKPTAPFQPRHRKRRSPARRCYLSCVGHGTYVLSPLSCWAEIRKGEGPGVMI